MVCERFGHELLTFICIISYTTDQTLTISQLKLKAQSLIKFSITLVLTVDLVPICFKIKKILFLILLGHSGNSGHLSLFKPLVSQELVRIKLCIR